MGVTYQRLVSPPASRARGWALLRWAALRLGCAARRRWCARARRRLAWPGLCGRKQGAAPAAAAERRGRRRSSGSAAVAYDSASYARNFDDGAWKAEEGVSWAGAAGAGAFPRASVSDDAMATGDSVARSTS